MMSASWRVATTKMIVPRCPSAVRIVAWLLILSAKIRVHGSKNPACPRNAVVDSSVENSGDVFEHSDEDRTGCPCSIKTCLMLCCPFGKARTEGRCVEDNDTRSELPETTPEFDRSNNEPEGIYHIVTDDPCAVGWMEPSVLESYQVFSNGSIHSPDFEGDSVLDFEHYCLFREPGSAVYSAKACRPKTRAVYDIICLIIATLTMLAIFVGYTIVPELRNFHGLIFRSYVATYIGTYLCSLGAQFTIESRTHAKLFILFEIIGNFTAISSALWLNVISFDIWRTFRVIRSIDNTIKQRATKRFVWYAIYAWIIPAIMVASFCAVISCVPYFLNDTFGEIFKQWTTVTFVISVCVCNTFMYTATALRIVRQKKDTADLADGVNNVHHDDHKRLFKLHVKLFVIMGGHMVMWAIWLSWTIPLMTRLLVTLEVIQSFLIFFLFIWKDSVKQSILKRFRDTLSSVNQCLHSRKFLTRANES